MAADEVTRAVRFHQKLPKKRLPRHFHHRAVEMRKDHIVDAVQPPHQQRPVVHRVDEPDRLTEHQRVRMAVEAHCRRAHAQRVRALPCPAQQRAVSGMDAVKKAKRDHAPLFHVHHTSKKLFTVVRI